MAVPGNSDRIRDNRVWMMLDRMRAAWNTDGSGLDAERAAFQALAGHFPTPEAVIQRSVQIGGVAAIDTRPVDQTSDDIPTFLYLHGGAFVIGSAEIYMEQSARIATASGARIITLDYRLAPEHPFPAAVDDTVHAYRALIESGIAPGRIVIGGDSAGGNLALAASMRLRDESSPLPAGMVLISPWVDLTCSSGSMESNADSRHLAQRDGLLRSAGTYLGNVDAGRPEASPLFGEVTDLPPALIQVGALETLLDESVRLERRLAESGNQVQLHIYEGMVHEWHLLSALLPVDDGLCEAADAVAEIGDFVRDVTST